MGNIVAACPHVVYAAAVQKIVSGQADCHLVFQQPASDDCIQKMNMRILSGSLEESVSVPDVAEVGEGDLRTLKAQVYLQILMKCKCNTFFQIIGRVYKAASAVEIETEPLGGSDARYYIDIWTYFREHN